MSGTRVVLVKPGDVLVLGNLGELDEATFDEIGSLLRPLKEQLGLAQVVVFEGDIDLASVPVDDEVVRRNLAVLRHEAETPMREHDEDGECCRLAASGDGAGA